MLLGVGLGDRRQFAAARARLGKAEAQDALDARAGEDRGFHGHLVGRADMDPAPGSRIFAFGVLADAEDVEAFRAKRPFDARQKPVRPDVRILPERLADRQKQAVQGNGIGHLGGPADGAEEDRVEGAQRLDAVCGHHRAGLAVEVAGPGKARALQREAAQNAGALQNAPRGIDDRDSDTVAGDQRDSVDLHGIPRKGTAGPLLLVDADVDFANRLDRPPDADEPGLHDEAVSRAECLGLAARLLDLAEAG